MPWSLGAFWNPKMPKNEKKSQQEWAFSARHSCKIRIWSLARLLNDWKCKKPHGNEAGRRLKAKNCKQTTLRAISRPKLLKNGRKYFEKWQKWQSCLFTPPIGQQNRFTVQISLPNLQSGPRPQRATFYAPDVRLCITNKSLGVFSLIAPPYSEFWWVRDAQIQNTSQPSSQCFSLRTLL